MELASDPQNRSCETLFQQGIKANDSTIENWTSYLRWLLLNDRVKDAEELVRQATETIPNLIQSDRNMTFLNAVLARYQKRFDQAEKLLSGLHRSNPQDIGIADQLALVLVESSDEGKRARAVQLSENNLRRSPRSETAIATAAWIQFRLGSQDIAGQMLDQLASVTKVSPQTAYYIAQVLKSKGQEKEAEMVLEAAIKAPGFFVERREFLTK